MPRLFEGVEGQHVHATICQAHLGVMIFFIAKFCELASAPTAWKLRVGVEVTLSFVGGQLWI